MWNIIGRYMYSVTLCRVDIAMLTSVANHQHHCVCGCDTVNLFIVSSLFFLIEGKNIISVQLNVYVNVDRQPRGAAVFYTYFIVAVNVKRMTEYCRKITVVSYSSVVFAQDCCQCANSKQFALKVNKMLSLCNSLAMVSLPPDWLRGQVGANTSRPFCEITLATCSTSTGLQARDTHVQVTTRLRPIVSVRCMPVDPGDQSPSSFESYNQPPTSSRGPEPVWVTGRLTSPDHGCGTICQLRSVQQTALRSSENS